MRFRGPPRPSGRAASRRWPGGARARRRRARPRRAHAQATCPSAPCSGGGAAARRTRCTASSRRASCCATWASWSRRTASTPGAREAPRRVGARTAGAWVPRPAHGPACPLALPGHLGGRYPVPEARQPAPPTGRARLPRGARRPLGTGQAGRARSGGPRGASRSGCHGESPAEELSDAEAHASADRPEDAARGAKRSMAAAAAARPAHQSCMPQVQGCTKAGLAGWQQAVRPASPVSSRSRQVSPTDFPTGETGQCRRNELRPKGQETARHQVLRGRTRPSPVGSRDAVAAAGPTIRPSANYMHSVPSPAPLPLPSVPFRHWRC